MKNKLLLCATLLLPYSFASAQPSKTYTNEDYQRATEMLAGNASRFVDNMIQPSWLPDGRLWYRALTDNQAKFILFNPADGKKTPFASRKELMDGLANKPNTNSGPRTEIPSPDGKYVAFIRDWNLWIKDAATGKEKALTTDGIKNF